MGCNFYNPNDKNICMGISSMIFSHFGVVDVLDVLEVLDNEELEIRLEIDSLIPLYFGVVDVLDILEEMVDAGLEFGLLISSHSGLVEEEVSRLVKLGI